MVKQPAEVHTEEPFEPEIGAIAAETWWRLGSRIASVTGAKSKADRSKALDNWVREMREELRQHTHISPNVVTRERLEKFIDDVMRVLEAKYKREPVAKDVAALTRCIGQGDTVEDDGLYLRFVESEESFWALEYDAVFNDMQKRSKPGAPGWEFAVARCEAQDCGKFFVKGRSDTRFHSDECRTKTANRAAYKAKKEKPGHGTRARYGK